MKSYLHKSIIVTGLMITYIPAVMAGGVIVNQPYLYPNSYFRTYSNPATVVLRNGTVTYISSGTSYSSGYPAYPVYPAYPAYPGYQNNIYPGRHGNKLHKKLLPSTHIYGAYPTRKYYDRPRVNPHASSYQKKHAYGYKTDGYNHFSRRGNGSWYRY